MKAIFYTLSLLVIGGAAYLSSVNKENFLEQQKSRSETIQRRLRVFKSANQVEDELKEEKGKKVEAEKVLAEVEATITKLKSDEQTLKRELGEVDGQLESQQSKLAAASEALDKLKTALEGLGIPGPVNIDTIKEKLRQLDDEKKELELAVSELETTIAKGRDNVAKNRDEISRLVRRKAERDERMRANAREAVITAVDQNWGFVVIGAGSSSGFNPNGALLVKREGRIIGQVKPTSIEPSQTIANINLDVLAPGVVLQPGDRVILADPATN